MSRINDLVAKLCPGGVPFRPLGELGAFIRGSGVQKKDLTDEGLGAIHYGEIHTHYGTSAIETKSFVAEASAARLRTARPGDLVIATTSEDDDGVAKAVAWIGQDEVAVSSDAYIYRHGLHPEYVAYFFQSDQFQDQKKRFVTGTKVRRVSGESLAKVKMPVPPPAVQQAVAATLSKMEELEAALEAELEARRRQYEHYRHSLLSFGTEGARWTTLSELFEMRAGSFVAASEISASRDTDHPYPCFGGGGLRGYVGRSNQHGDRVLIGRQGALCGNVKRASGDFYATEHAVVVTARPNVDIRWAFHMLSAMNLNQYATKSAQPGLAVGSIGTLSVCVPRYQQQERTGEVLDKFDALVNDLSIGLPAELKARRKQYEHYRDRLLSFPEAA